MVKKLKVLAASVIGNALEFYDFTLFGAFTVKMSALFWAPGDETQKVMSQLLVFAMGFFARPLGALFFGAMGDRRGRKHALGFSILLMGAATLCIGLLPTYESLGYGAPMLLLALRCVQGFSLGGENNGSAIFFLEHLKERKGLAGALILTGGGIGTLLAFTLSWVTSLEGMPEYAWRIPFILGFFMALIGLYIRRSLPETEEFLDQKPRAVAHRTPLSHVWTHHRTPFLCAIGIGGVNVALAYTTSTYLHVYIKQIVGWTLVDALQMTCIAVVLFGGIFAPLMGHLADRLSTRRVMHMGCLCLALLAFPLFYVLRTGQAAGVYGGIVMMAFLQAIFNGPTNAHLNELFPASVRYTAVAFGYALGAALFGGMAPYYYSTLIAWTGHPLAPGLYMVAMAGLGYVSLWGTERTARSHLMTPETKVTF